MNRMHVLGMALTTLLTGASIAAVGCTTTTNVTDDPGDAATDVKKPRDSGVPEGDGAPTECTPSDKTGYTPAEALKPNATDTNTAACSAAEIDKVAKAFADAIAANSNAPIDAWVTEWKAAKGTTCNKCLMTEEASAGTGAGAFVLTAEGPQLSAYRCLNAFKPGCGNAYNEGINCIKYVCRAPICQDATTEFPTADCQKAAFSTTSAPCRPEVAKLQSSCNGLFGAEGAPPTPAETACFSDDDADEPAFVKSFLTFWCAGTPPVKADGG
jgi:hypothetical protein